MPNVELLTAVILLVFGGGGVVGFWRMRGERSVSIADAYSRLVNDLEERLDDVEQGLAEERERCDGLLAEKDKQIKGLEEAVAEIQRNGTTGTTR